MYTSLSLCDMMTYSHWVYRINRRRRREQNRSQIAIMSGHRSSISRDRPETIPANRNSVPDRFYGIHTLLRTHNFSLLCIATVPNPKQHSFTCCAVCVAYVYYLCTTGKRLQYNINLLYNSLLYMLLQRLYNCASKCTFSTSNINDSCVISAFNHGAN